LATQNAAITARVEVQGNLTRVQTRLFIKSVGPMISRTFSFEGVGRFSHVEREMKIVMREKKMNNINV
jgi:hypothetical protein